MPESKAKKRPRVFISHASDNLDVAQKVEAALDAAGFDPWLDRSDIRVGVLLGEELQQAVEACQAVVLIWSQAASASRWVATEVLTAFHLDRFIVPCVLSETELPQFLSRSIFLDLRSGQRDALERLGEQVKRVPRSRNPITVVTSYQSQELEKTIHHIYGQQAAVLNLLDGDDLAGARKMQAKLDTEMRAAEKRWRYDPVILNLAGFHHKNSYMLKHWEEFCAGRFPKDDELQEGEQRFFDTLFVNPIDYGALNGLGNILLFEGELCAAEFFIDRAVQCAAKNGVVYQEAIDDLARIRRRTQGGAHIA